LDNKVFDITAGRCNHKRKQNFQSYERWRYLHSHAKNGQWMFLGYLCQCRIPADP